MADHPDIEQRRAPETFHLSCHECDQKSLRTYSTANGAVTTSQYGKPANEQNTSIQRYSAIAEKAIVWIVLLATLSCSSTSSREGALCAAIRLA